MVHVSLMFLSEWCEFPSVPCLAGKETWWQLASWCCWNRARRLTCFLSASVTRKDLQFSTWTDHLSTDIIDSVLRHGEVRRAKDLPAHPHKTVWCQQFLTNQSWQVLLQLGNRNASAVNLTLKFLGNSNLGSDKDWLWKAIPGGD